jgi:ABC-type glycerol-3-phosphate transport system substrate-binding protein
VIATVLAGAMSLTALTACSSVEDQKSDGPVEIEFWSNQAGAGPDETANMKSMISDFNTSQTKYRISWKTYPLDS